MNGVVAVLDRPWRWLVGQLERWPAGRRLVASSRRPATLTLLLNAVMAIVAYRLAFALRFDLAAPPHARRIFFATLPGLLLTKLVVFRQRGLNDGFARHVSVRDVEAPNT